MSKGGAVAAAMIVAVAELLAWPTDAPAQSCTQVAAAQGHIAEERDRGVPLATIYLQIEQSFPDGANVPEILRGLRASYVEERKRMAAGIYQSGKSADDVRDEAMRACKDLKVMVPRPYLPETSR